MYAIEVEHPIHGWTRLKARYGSRRQARSWFKFVRAAWHGAALRVVEVKTQTQETP